MTISGSFVPQIMNQSRPEFALAASDCKAGCNRSIVISRRTAGLSSKETFAARRTDFRFGSEVLLKHIDPSASHLGVSLGGFEF